MEEVAPTSGFTFRHALVERGGQMRMKHVADVSAKTLRKNLKELADRKSTLNTDEALAYHWVDKKLFADHRVVNHSQDEYVSRRVTDLDCLRG